MFKLQYKVNAKADNLFSKDSIEDDGMSDYYDL